MDGMQTAMSAVQRARAVAPVVAEAGAAIEATRSLPVAVLDALHGAKLFRTLLPRPYGGEELPPFEQIQMIEAIAQADASTAWCLGQACGCSMSAAYLEHEVAQEIWGDDPRAVLAWGIGPDARADKVPGGWRVNGRWSFLSGGRHATWVGGHVQVPAPGGFMVERSMLFRREQAIFTEDWDVIGLRGTGSDRYEVRDLFVPDAFCLKRDVDEERRYVAPLYRFNTTQIYASSFAAVALGIARGALDAFVVLAREKTPGSMTRALCDSPVVQSEVAVAEARLRAARALLLDTWREVWSAPEITMDHRASIRLATTYASQQAVAVVDTVYREAGATAIFERNPFERRFRDVHAVSQQVQARFAHFELVGQHLLGQKVSTRFI